MASGCSAKTLNNSDYNFDKINYIHRSKQGQRNKSTNRYTIQKYATGFTDTSDPQLTGDLER